MSRKHFSTLLLATVIAVIAVALLVPRQSSKDDGAMGNDPLLPGLSEHINAVERVVFDRSNESVSVYRTEDAWAIEDLDGYPASWEKLRQLLGDLAQARILELKTDNPDYYERLGVKHSDSEPATGIRVTLYWENQSRSIILGKSASGREGQYARLADAARSVLVDKEMEASVNAVDWADRQIIDLPSGEVSELEIIHPDGDWIRARKGNAADTDFTLESLPEGREISSAWSVNSLAGALSALQMDAVRPAIGDAPDDAVRFRALTFGGLEYIVDAWTEDGSHWLMLSATTPAAVTPIGEADVQIPEIEVSMSAEAERFNEARQGWQFRIPEYKFSSLGKRQADLLKPLESDADTANP